MENNQLRDKKPNISDFEEPIMMDIIKNIDEFLFFMEITFSESDVIKKNDEIFKFRESEAIFENGKITLLTGSLLPNPIMSIANVKDSEYSDSNKNTLRKMSLQLENWVQNNMAEIIDNKYKLLINIKNISPSLACCYAAANYAFNGWDQWKNKKGKTLDEVYRK